MIREIIILCSLLSAAFLIVLFISALIIQHNHTSYYSGPASTHFDGKKFYNPPPYKTKNILDLLHWSLQNKKQQWPHHVENTSHPDLNAVSKDKVKATFINHATVLIQTEHVNILTDPIWSKRASPVSWYGPKRVRNPGIAFKNLPKIDVVVISHNHYDHLDLQTLKLLEKTFHPLFLVPLGNRSLLHRHGIARVIELDWWQVYRSDKMIITFLPAQHWSARWLNDKCSTLWGSYGIEIANRKIYFAGDTGYSKNFELIKQRWGRPDLAFLPLGSYLPKWFMQENHMNTSEALQAHEDLGANKSVAIHFGTFQLSDEGINQPIKDLQKAIVKKPALAQHFYVLDVGESKIF